MRCTSLIVALCGLLIAPAALAEFQDQTVDECLEEMAELFAVVISTDECRQKFKEVTGTDPVEVYALDDIVLVTPAVWMIYGAGAITVCRGGSAPRIALNAFYIYTVGAIIGANVLVHELAHVAMCDRKLNSRKEERLACEVAEACVPIGTNCRTQAKRSSHLSHRNVTAMGVNDD